MLHGITDAVTHLQSSRTGIITADLLSNTLIWLDNILIPAPTVEQLVEATRSFFQLCYAYITKLHLAKCILFAKEVRCCGRHISVDVIRY